MNNYLRFLGLAFVLGGFVAANGQTKAELPSQPYLSLHEQSAWLLDYKNVRSGLGLSAGELQGVDAAFQKYGEDEMQGPPSRQKMETLDHRLAHAAVAALTGDHQKRLFEVLLQVEGVTALGDEGIAKEVGLTAEQSLKVRELMTAAGARDEAFNSALAEKIIALPRIAPDSVRQQQKKAIIDAAAPEGAILKRQRMADERKVAELLTPTQKKTWRALLGSPFPLARLSR